MWPFAAAVMDDENLF